MENLILNPSSKASIHKGGRFFIVALVEGQSPNKQRLGAGSRGDYLFFVHWISWRTFSWLHGVQFREKELREWTEKRYSTL